jgi:hypothetical protein
MAQDDELATFDNKAVLKMFETLDTKLTLLDTKVTDLTKNMVGWERCQDGRARCIAENGNNFQEIFKRLIPIEATCNAFSTLQPILPSEADVMKCSADALKTARDEDKNLQAGIDSINRKLAFLDSAYWSGCKIKSLFKNNKEFRVVCYGIILLYMENSFSLVGIVLGRIKDFYLCNLQ